MLLPKASGITYIMILLLTACQPALPTPQQEQGLTIVGGADNTPDNILIRIDWVKIGREVGDIVGKGELVFDLLVTRQNGDSRRLQAPGEGNYSVGSDNKISLDGFSLSVNDVSSDEKILVYFLAFENDELSFGTNTAASTALDGATTVLGEGLKAGKLGGQAIKHSNLIAFILSELTGIGLDWWQEADILGGYAVLLEPSNGWLLGKQYEGMSDNGNVTVQFTITADDEPITVIAEVPVTTVPTLPPTIRPAQPPPITLTATRMPPARTSTAVTIVASTNDNSSPFLEWVFIPSSSFTMGSSAANIQTALAECNETEGAETGQPCQITWFNEPQIDVSINDFEINKYEITNGEYQACVAADVCKEAGRNITDDNIPYDSGYFADGYPVVGVSWYDANTFCQWVDGRLPTEAEWERAARGSDGRRYPWGDTFDSSKANLDSGYPSPVGSFPSGASSYGVMDMAGNVFEWTATQVGSNYVLRGGGWSKYYFRGRVTDRGTQLLPTFANYDIGFRCAK